MKLKRRFITLVEMMIVMFLIAMITGVIAYNYTGSLEEGKSFKTTQGMGKIQNILNLYLAANPEEYDNIESSWKSIIKSSKLVKNPDDLIRDGWGAEYEVTRDENGEIQVKSERYNNYKSKSKGGSLFNK
jgi:general secretion pathway protein G